jgi:predicted transposase YbfD/YdcC
VSWSRNKRGLYTRRKAKKVVGVLEMITVIVFSKDRACQTELMIRSMKEKFHVPTDIHLQYTSTSEEYEKGFERTFSIHKDVKLHKESNFKETLTEILSGVETEHIVFFTDDDVFVKDVDFCNYDKGYHCFSLRMNPSINKCYPANNKDIKSPSLMQSFTNHLENTMYWKWTEAEDQACCWGYPMAINSHIYRSHDIIPLIKRGQYHNVNSLEAYINHKRWFDKPYMLSFTETKVFNVQNNFVQGPRMNEQKYSVEWLNEQFLAGKRISTENIYGLEPQAAHGTIEYVMEDV